MAGKWKRLRDRPPLESYREIVAVRPCLRWIGRGAFEVGMGRQETLLYSWTGMGVYFGLLTLFCVLLYRRFGKKAMRDT